MLVHLQLHSDKTKADDDAQMKVVNDAYDQVKTYSLRVQVHAANRWQYPPRPEKDVPATPPPKGGGGEGGTPNGSGLSAPPPAEPETFVFDGDVAEMADAVYGARKSEEENHGAGGKAWFPTTP